MSSDKTGGAPTGTTPTGNTLWGGRFSESTDAFGVSSIEEGLKLRAAGITQPVCLLEGFFTADELPLLSKQHLEPVVHSEAQLRALATAPAWTRLD